MSDNLHLLDKLILWLTSSLMPFVVLLALLFVGAWPQMLPVPHQATQTLVLCAMVYWGLLSAQGFSWVLMIIVAMIADALFAQPQGTSLIVWAICLGMSQQQRRFLLSQRFVVVWAMLGVLAAFALQLSWVLTGLFSQNWGQWWLCAYAWVWVVAFMPVLMWLIEPCQKLSQQWAADL